MPRFVILRHELPPTDTRGLHWDLMLENAETLWTWALPQEPVGERMEMIAARLPDHRPAYLDYEGAVSNQRGTVRRWDAGTFEWEQPLTALDEPSHDSTVGSALMSGQRGSYRIEFQREPATTSLGGDRSLWRLRFDFRSPGDNQFARA